MSTWRCASSVLFCAVLCGQQADGVARAAPPGLRFGQVHEGSVVQAAFALEWPAGTTGALEVEAPPTVRVLRRSDDELVVAIATVRSGPVDGSILLRRGKATLEVPVQGIVLAPMPGQSRVLAVGAPWSASTTGDLATFAPWLRVVETGKLECHYVVEPTDGRVIDVGLLQRIDVVLIAETGLLSLTEGDRRLLQGFVCGGGRLVVCASPFFAGTIAAANELVEPFGLRMDAEQSVDGEPHEVAGAGIAEHQLTARVRALRVRKPSPTALLDARARPLVLAPELFGDRPVVAIARTASGGEVVTLGCPLWWLWVGEAPDNAVLLRNLLTRRPQPPR